MNMSRLNWASCQLLAGILASVTGCGISDTSASREKTPEATGSVKQAATAVTAGANVNVTRMLLNQSEESIGIDPTNPQRLFIGTNSEPSNAGIFAAFSTDGGNTWSSSTSAGDTNPGDFLIANANDSLTPACCDPTVSFDTFGNLFYGYLGNGADIAISTDAGANFANLVQLTASDQPTLATGPGLNGANGSLWITYDSGGATIVVQGAAVNGLGAAQVGAFTAPVTVPVGQFGDIAVGPNGEVMVAGQTGGGSGGATISVVVDPDGFGAQPFGAATTFATNVGLFDQIPSQNNPFGIDAEAGLAFDRSNGAHRGRAYVVYTIENPDESNDTDIVLRFSDDNGANWSNEIRVNDDTTQNAQWLPRIAVDQTTGFVAVSFHDARNDDGLGGAGDTDGVANTNSQRFVAISLDGGQTFRPNVQVSTGTSDQVGDDPPAAGLRDIDYGDFSGLAFESGGAYSAWADNSNSTGDNPSGALSNYDVYTARVTVHANQPPVAVCKDKALNADATCHATFGTADVNGGSFDPDDPPPTCTAAPTGSVGLGATSVTLTCTDGEGASSSCTATVTVTDKTAPTFTFVPPALTVTDCSAPSIGTATATDNCGGVTITNNAPAVFPLGTTTVTWTATDAAGNTATATQQVSAELGDDPSCCPAGTNIIIGTAASNVIFGTPGSDCILGRGGNDHIFGLGGNDFLSGGDGNDEVDAGDGNDYLTGGAGIDVLEGDDGNDTLIGDAGNDILEGGSGSDVCDGGLGDDHVDGDSGNDTLRGGPGADFLEGDSGNDILEGGDGNDQLFGGLDNDTLNGGPGTDHCDGGLGTDTTAMCE